MGEHGMRARERALPLTSCSTRERGHTPSSEQHIRTGHGSVGVKEPAPPFGGCVLAYTRDIWLFPLLPPAAVLESWPNDLGEEEWVR